MLESIQKILPPGRRPRLLVVGDLILDEFLRGVASRISPEAPVPVLDSRGAVSYPGGAGNVAANLAALGCKATLCGVVGDDDHGRRLRLLLGNRGIGTDGILIDPTRPTTHKLRVLAQSRQVLRVDNEARGGIAASLQRAVLDFVRHHVSAVSGVICSDYRKGLLTPLVLAGVIEAAHDAGLPVTVDPKGDDYSRYHGADVLTPNLDELETAVGKPIASPVERDAAVERLFAETSARAVLVTCGREGMVLYRKDGARTPISAEAREVFDVTGAGDTVAAWVGLALSSGASLAEAARLANRAAGIAVGKLGTATVSREEIMADLGVTTGNGGGKVVSREAAQGILQAARDAGKTVVFTNGCFDLLHAGHVDYLEAARRAGDILVVGVNADASVRRLKGPDRPLVPAEDRARVVAGLAAVDLVVIFEEETPADLVAALRPQVLAKGADYEEHEVAGRDTVMADGGQIELIPLTPGRSTSDLIDRIRASEAGRIEDA
jgi:D-beta-D-heptose 7-phosphate kinase/D-beta-D-heptose 1-phosphate adenosyltransferase